VKRGDAGQEAIHRLTSVMDEAGSADSEEETIEERVETHPASPCHSWQRLHLGPLPGRLAASAARPTPRRSRKLVTGGCAAQCVVRARFRL